MDLRFTTESKLEHQKLGRVFPSSLDQKREERKLNRTQHKTRESQKTQNRLIGSIQIT